MDIKIVNPVQSQSLSGSVAPPLIEDGQGDVRDSYSGTDGTSKSGGCDKMHARAADYAVVNLAAGSDAVAPTEVPAPTTVASTQTSHLQTVQRALKDGSLATNGYIYGNRVGFGPLDVDGITHCDAFTMLLDHPKAEDAIVAAGIALANQRPSIYMVANRCELPWFLREADLTFPGRVTIVESTTAVPQVLPAGGTQELPAPHVDSFIGSLMSGLTEIQYQEGRAHLQAIDQTLRSRGSNENMCEALKVVSTTTFDKPRDSLLADLDAVRGSDRCIFYLYDAQPRPSGTWVEAGMAIGLCKPTTFLVPDRQALPPCLRGSDLPSNVHVVVYGSHATLLAELVDGSLQL